MPIASTIERDTIVLTASGSYTTDELKHAVLAALDDPLAPPGAVMLFDLRLSEAIRDRSPADMRDMATFLAHHGPRYSNRLAMVVTADHDFGMMRMGEVIAENLGIEPMVFRDMDKARAWLAKRGQG